MKWYLVKKDWGPHKEGTKLELSEEDAKALVESGHLEEIQDSPIKAELDEAMKDVRTNIGLLVATAVKDALGTIDIDGKKVKISDIHVGKDRREDDPTFGFGPGDHGLGEFAQSVRMMTSGQGMDERLKMIMAMPEGKAEKAPTGANEGIGEEGGVLVPPEQSNRIWERAIVGSNIIPLLDRYTVTGNSMTFLQEAGDTRAAGVRHGGVRGYWVEEGGQGTGSQPKFRRMQLRLKKLMILVYATDELLEDSSISLGQYLTRKAGDEINFQVGDALINGNGIGKPLGILNAPCTVSIAKETSQVAATIVRENISKMWARWWAPSRSRPSARWHMNQDIEPELDNLHAGGTTTTSGAFPHIPLYMPPGGLADRPLGNIKGRGVQPLEWCPTLGTVGDLLCADWSEYCFIAKGSVKSAVSIHLRFDYDETVFKFSYRCDGQPWWPAALTPFKGSNTLSPFISLATRA